jgi:hypothetical protein
MGTIDVFQQLITAFVGRMGHEKMRKNKGLDKL